MNKDTNDERSVATEVEQCGKVGLIIEGTSNKRQGTTKV